MPEVYSQLKFLIRIYKSCKSLSEENKEVLRHMQAKVMEIENEYEQ
jgi:hypothetical protein